MNLGLLALIMGMFSNDDKGWPFWKRLKDGFMSKQQLTKKYGIKWDEADQAWRNLRK